MKKINLMLFLFHVLLNTSASAICPQGQFKLVLINSTGSPQCFSLTDGLNTQQFNANQYAVNGNDPYQVQGFLCNAMVDSTCGFVVSINTCYELKPCDWTPAYPPPLQIKFNGEACISGPGGLLIEYDQSTHSFSIPPLQQGNTSAYSVGTCRICFTDLQIGPAITLSDTLIESSTYIITHQNVVTNLSAHIRLDAHPQDGYIQLDEGFIASTTTGSLIAECMDGCGPFIPGMSNTVEHHVSACDTFQWSIDGMLYTATGDYYYIDNLNNINHHLSLIIHQRSSTTSIITACDAYTSPLNGLTYTASGVYYLQGLNYNGCIHTDTLDLTIHSAPAISVFSSSQGVCSGNSVILQASGSPDIVWKWDSMIVATGSVFITPALTNNVMYVAVGTDANGCSATSSISILVNPLPEIAVNIQPQLCGALVIVEVSAISGSFPFVGEGSFYVNSSGTYTYSIIDGNGCEADTTVTINVPPALIVTSAVTGNTATIFVSGGTPPYMYTWNGQPNGQTVSGLSPGLYLVVVMDINGCMEIVYVTIVATPCPPITATVSASSACNGDTIMLFASSVYDPNYDYTWTESVNGSLVSTFGNTVNAIVSVNTTYTVTGTDLMGCSASTTVDVVLDTGCTQTVRLKYYIQGYYDPMSGIMTPALYNRGLSLSPLDCDSVEIIIIDSIINFNPIFQVNALLNTFGVVSFDLPANIVGTPKWIRIGTTAENNNRQLSTWSASPVTLPLPNKPIGDSIDYDFSIAASQAFGSNQVEVEAGVWAVYNGDLNMDDNIDLLDYPLMENDIFNFAFGDVISDVNGDGNSDLLDAAILEANIFNFIYVMHP